MGVGRSEKSRQGSVHVGPFLRNGAELNGDGEGLLWREALKI